MIDAAMTPDEETFSGPGGAVALLMRTAEQWSGWLQRHHAEAREVWLVTYKKGSGKRSLDYESALDEATCYGWVDVLVRGATPEYYLQRWVPRRVKGNWTPANRERARRLAAAGRMRPAGWAVLPPDLRAELDRVAPSSTAELP
jgi:uncharacterized protein YdeI (YjbR/CyaY-like superfamily)